MKSKLDIIVYIFTIALIGSLIYFFVLKKVFAENRTTKREANVLDYYDVDELKEAGMFDSYDFNNLTDEQLIEILTHGHLH